MKQNFLFRKLYTAASCLLLSASMFAQTTPVVWEGDGSADAPYKIKTADDLAAIAAYTSQGVQFTNVHFKMTNDIDLSGIANWTPIGNGENHFNGIFDGDGKTILNLKIDGSDCSGLFGIIEDAVLKNFSIAGTSTVKGAIWTGAVCGGAYGASLISNIHNYATVIGTTNFGGILGVATDPITISNCVNEGAISSSSAQGKFAGVVGLLSKGGILDSNTNNGTITSSSGCVAGIVASCFEGASVPNLKLTVTNCKNTAQIKGVGGLVAGILAYCIGDDARTFKANITNCDNSGKIINTNGEFVSGVVADLGVIGAKIDNCTNSGAIVNDVFYRYVGGILGYGNHVDINNCTNKPTGSITLSQNSDNTDVSTRAGGIAGRVTGGYYRDVYIRNCKNEATIFTDGAVVGGILGDFEGQYSEVYIKAIDNCTNTGEVTATGRGAMDSKDVNTGGILGVGPALVINCVNSETGYIKVYWSNAGGIAGALASIMNCRNDGPVHNIDTGGTYAQSHSQYIGGLLGFDWVDQGMYFFVFNSFSTGNVLTNGVHDQGAGTLAGSGYVPISYCYSNGTVYYGANTHRVVGSSYTKDAYNDKPYYAYVHRKEAVYGESTTREDVVYDTSEEGITFFNFRDNVYKVEDGKTLLDVMNNGDGTSTPPETMSFSGHTLQRVKWESHDGHTPTFVTEPGYEPIAPTYYMVKYDLNAPGNPSGMSAPMSQTGATSYTVSSVNGSALSYVYNNVKYTFQSWNTKEDGTGVNYEPGSMISPLDGDVTLYGVWKKGFQLRYALASDMHLSDFTALTLPVDGTWYDTDHTTATVAAPTAFTRSDGKVFAFWSTEPDGGGEHYEESDEITVTQDMVLYANVSNPVKQQIVIRRSGLKDGESAIYNITGPDSYTATVVLTGDRGGSEVCCTIAPSAGLATGDYTVTETTWDWSYGDATIDVIPASKKGEVTESSATGTLSDSSVLTFTFASTQKDNVAKHHESIKIEKL